LVGHTRHCGAEVIDIHKFNMGYGEVHTTQNGEPSDFTKSYTSSKSGFL